MVEAPMGVSSVSRDTSCDLSPPPPAAASLRAAEPLVCLCSSSAWGETHPHTPSHTHTLTHTPPRTYTASHTISFTHTHTHTLTLLTPPHLEVHEGPCVPDLVPGAVKLRGLAMVVQDGGCGLGRQPALLQLQTPLPQAQVAPDDVIVMS